MAGASEAILKWGGGGGGGGGKSLTFSPSTFYLLSRPYPRKFDICVVRRPCMG